MNSHIYTYIHILQKALQHPWLAQNWELHRKNSMKMDKDNEGAKNIVTSLKKFSEYSKLRKAALMVVAHQSQSIEITKMRNGKTYIYMFLYTYIKSNINKILICFQCLFC
jgi:hypothetical protein